MNQGGGGGGRAGRGARGGGRWGRGEGNDGQFMVLVSKQARARESERERERESTRGGGGGGNCYFPWLCGSFHGQHRLFQSIPKTKERGPQLLQVSHRPRNRCACVSGEGLRPSLSECKQERARERQRKREREILGSSRPAASLWGGARGRPGGPAVGSSRPAGWTSLRAGEGLSPPPKLQDHSGPDISISLRFTAMVGTVPPSSQKRSAGRTPVPNLGQFVTRGDRDCNLHLRLLPRGMAPPPLMRLPRRRPAGRTPFSNLGKFVT